jgi:flagellar hook-associated protein 2
MASITSLGIGSGVDVNTIVTQLVALESRPLSQMRSEASALQTQVSSYGQLSSLFSSLQTAASKLTNPGLWSQAKAASNDDSVVQAIGGSGAAAGNYTVDVTSLASSQTVVAGSSLASSAESVGSGVMTLEIGSWDQPPMNFVPRHPGHAARQDQRHRRRRHGLDRDRRQRRAAVAALRCHRRRERLPPRGGR